MIIPVYNAENFVAKAVESALNEPEVREVILVEDGSADGSLGVCRTLENKYGKVQLYSHPNHANLGAGISRNFGIQKATSDYVAFLDADDFYLPGRFKEEKRVFTEIEESDGVYGALGFHYYTEQGRREYDRQGFGALTTVSGKIPPTELFWVLMGMHEKFHGYFSINTLTIKKTALLSSKVLFNNFQLHEDTIFFIQLSLTCKLFSGEINSPIGMRGVHNYNRIVNREQHSDRLVKMWAYLYKWSLQSNVGKTYANVFRASLMKEEILFSNRWMAKWKVLVSATKNKLFLHKSIFFSPAALYAFGRTGSNYIIHFKEAILQRFFKISPYELPNEQTESRVR